jgi:site-specific DNA-methyltransferase (adenine-specific)
MKKFPENYFDMIFADPPYFLSSGSFTCQNGKQVSVKKAEWDMGKGLNENFNFHLDWIKACRRILKPEGTIWISGTYHSIYQCGFILQNTKFRILNDIAWYKPNASPNLSCRFFQASHESLIWARKKEKAKHTFNYEYMKKHKESHKNKIKCSSCNKINFQNAINKANKQMRSVWSINTPPKEEKKYGKHPTQKPLELLKTIILASTKPGDKILDPFTGSSTTGLAANQSKRKFVGIDNDKKYLDLSIKRLNSLFKL